MQCTDFCIGNSFTKVQGDRPTQWLGKSETGIVIGCALVSVLATHSGMVSN